MRLFAILSTIILMGSQAIAQEKFGVYDLMDLKFVSETAVSPNGKKVAYTVMKRRALKDGAGSNYTELYVMDVKSGESKALITGNISVSSLSWKPNTNIITFVGTFDAGRQIYGIDLDSEKTDKVVLTSIEQSFGSYHWHPSGNKVAYIAFERTGSKNEYFDLGFNAEVFEENLTAKNLYVYELETNEATLLVNDMAVHTVQWNPAGDQLACMISPENLVDQYYMNKRVYLVNPLNGDKKMIIENPGKMTDLSWSPDGNHIAIVCAADVHDPVSGSIFVQNVNSPKAFNQLKNYVGGLELSATHVKWYDSKTIIFSADESVETTISLQKIGTNSRSVVLAQGNAVFSNFSVEGRTVSFAGSTPAHPNELYTFDVKKKQLAKRSNVNSHLSNFKLAKQERITYEARDGLRIEGVLVYPLDYNKNNTYPLISYIHGGPESCVKNGWSTFYSMWGQVAAAKGYFVFMPNYRASSGRGIEYSKADFGDLADEEFNDVLDGIDYLVKNKGVDRNRVGIGGGSYGGYFSAWAATKHSEHFKASCVFVGVSNQISKRNTTDIPMEDYLVHWGIWTNEDIELIYDRSPVKYASNNTTPTLILHGKEDPRVHPSQSLELYRQLKLHGDAAVRLVWYPGEGHGNRKNPARIDYALRTMQWFDFYLLEGNDKDSIPDKDLKIEIE
ncbi:MAG: S9 family peptidase [Bacteroidia bacterium]